MRLHLPFLDSDAPLGSRILGSPTESPRMQRIRIWTLLLVLIGVSNAIGAAVVISLILWVIPGPSVLTGDMVIVNFVAVPIYIVLAFVVGAAKGSAIGLNALQWHTAGREPTKREQVAVLALPWRLTVLQGALWLGATLYAVGAGVVDSGLVPKVLFTITFGGIGVCAFSYMLSEFALRPAAARALEFGDPRRIRLARVSGRSVLAWLLGTGVPVAGLLVTAIYNYVTPVDFRDFARAMIVLSGTALGTGLLLTMVGVRATADPIRSVRDGMRKIERGDLDAHVIPYDGTELGELQTGFNRMVDGLRERERIRDLFGRHVGHEVAEAAMQSNPELGGEERSVAVFFVDIIGSTQLASTHRPHDVVGLLNRFFDVVVAETDQHGGFINKFEGDAALAIFGAPVDIDDPAGRALSAARKIHRRLLAEVPECSAAIGIAYGTAVAGNIGTRERFEYTVIGDPVNEAARLSELAKTVDGLVLASESAIRVSRSGEAERWKLGETVTLRGRSQPTRLAIPGREFTDADRRP